VAISKTMKSPTLLAYVSVMTMMMVVMSVGECENHRLIPFLDQRTSIWIFIFKNKNFVQKFPSFAPVRRWSL
jgi:hypothetical protein